VGTFPAFVASAECIIERRCQHADEYKRSNMQKIKLLAAGLRELDIQESLIVDH
jgi:hypothetical protein